MTSISSTALDYVIAAQRQRKALDDHINKSLEGVGYKNDPSPYSGGQYMHGVGGPLSVPGQDAALLSTIVQADSGLAGALPVLNDPVWSSEYGGSDTPFFASLTGVTVGQLDDPDNQPEAPCDDPPTAGVLKFCTQTATYGLYSGKTEPINRRRVGRLTNRGEMVDLEVLNNPAQTDPLIPEPLKGMGGTFINNEIRSRLFASGIAFQRLLRPQVWNGSPTNNSAAGGYREFSGIYELFNTGKLDAITQNPCPGLDSLIADFGNVSIDTANANGQYVYDVIRNMIAYWDELAASTGLTPWDLVITMHPNLFYQLSALWPVQQYVQFVTMMNTINNTGYGGNLNVSGEQVTAVRDDMRTRRFLPVDGRAIRIILDNTLRNDPISATNVSTDIIFTPMTVLGGVPVTFWNFFRYDNAQGRLFDEMVRGQTWTTDGGRVVWSFNQRNGCMELAWWTEPRIITHAPFLGGRLERVSYEPGIAFREPFPGDANYYNGGRTNAGTLPTIYYDWAPSGAKPFPTR